MLKNMLLYRILNPDHVDLLGNWEELGKALAEVPATLPVGSQWRTIGFDKPAPSLSDELVWSGQGGSTLFTFYFHERQLPGATIRDYVNEKVRKIEAREQRKCYRKEVAQMKDEAVAALLPKAFIKHSAVNVVVIGDLLIMGVSSAKKAEDCLCVLRDALGSLAIRPLTLKVPADTWLTDLMLQNGIGKIGLLDTGKVISSAKDSVAFKGVDLASDEPQAYLDNGFTVAEIGLQFDERLYFKVTSQLIFKAIKFADDLVSSVDADAQGDPAANLDGTLMLFVDAVTKLVDEIADQVGEDVVECKATDKFAGTPDELIEVVQDYLVNQNGRPTHGVLQRRYGVSWAVAERTLDALRGIGVLAEHDGEYTMVTAGGASYGLASAIAAVLAPIKNGGSLSINGELVAEVDEFGDVLTKDAGGDDL